MTGREWDAEKEENETRPDARRGFAGQLLSVSLKDTNIVS
jgi:hypothetical protein